MPEDTSQLTVPASEVSAQTPDATVTAAAPAAENATPQTNVNHASPQTQETGTTGAVVDEGKSDYKSRLEAFLNADEKVPEPEVRAPEAETSPPEAQTQTPPPTNLAPAPAAAPEDEEEPLIKNGMLPRRMRVKPMTPVDVRAVAEFNASQLAGNTQSFVEFVAERFPAKAPSAPAYAAAAETTATTTPAETLDHVTAEIERLEAEREKFNEDFEFDKAKAHKAKLDALRKRERELVIESVKPVEKPEDVEAKRAQEIEPYLIQAAKMFPQSVEATGPLATKAREVFNGWVANSDPRAAHPSANFYCYVEAAAELGIQPAGAATKQAPVTQTPTSPTPPVHRPPASALIAGGEARSQQTRAPEQQGTYEERKNAFLGVKAA